MYALSLWEPYASAFRVSYKHNETRSWKGPDALIGELLLICAAVRCTAEERDLVRFFNIEPHYGKAVAVVRVDGYVRSQNHKESSSLEKSLGDYSLGRWIWRTTSVDCSFDPFPVKGRQGLFTVDTTGRIQT